MTSLLLGVGKDISYDDLMIQLEEGEMLMVTWLPNPLNTLKVRPVTDKRDHSTKLIISSLFEFSCIHKYIDLHIGEKGGTIRR